MAGPGLHEMRGRRQWSPDARALSVVGDRWILLIARELASGPMRLAELRRAFPGMSTGALEQRLNRIVRASLVTRHRYAEVPPRVEFELTDAGRDLLAVLAPLARWALRWAWSEPQPEEWVDVTAMFRLASCVVSPPTDVTAELELIVDEPRKLVLDLYTLRIADGATAIVHRPADHADAVIKGTPEAWSQALGPAHAVDRLRISGDTHVAELFLSEFEPARG